MDKNERSSVLIFLLTPIVRFCLRRAISIQSLYELLKQCYVIEAKEYLRKQGVKVNTMKLSAITGMQRRDISRVSARETSKNTKNTGLFVRIIDKWNTDHSYKGKKDLTKRLTFDGPESDFYKLVYSVSKDLSPSGILDHLKNTGIVRVKGRYIHLEKKGYIPSGADLEIYQMLGLDIADLIAGVDENVRISSDPQSIKNLHATTEYDNIAIESLPTIKNWLLREGNKFHSKVRMFLSQHDQDSARDKFTKSGARVVFSCFSLTENRNEE